MAWLHLLLIVLSHQNSMLFEYFACGTIQVYTWYTNNVTYIISCIYYTNIILYVMLCKKTCAQDGEKERKLKSQAHKIMLLFYGWTTAPNDNYYYTWIMIIIYIPMHYAYQDYIIYKYIYIRKAWAIFRKIENMHNQW